jgi:hypothetical protein
VSTDERSKLDRIKAEYERDAALRPPARTLDEVPAFYECITPEWLTHVMRRRYPDATVQTLRLDIKDSGTTNRRRIFLEYAPGTAPGTYPSSVFCKGAQELANRITMSVGSAVGEVRFYNEIRPELSIEAPECFFAAVDLNSYRAIIVLQDMRAEAEFCNYRTPVSKARAESQIALLAAMHGRFYQSRAFAAEFSFVEPFCERFKRLTTYHGLESACDRGLVAAEPVIPAPILARRSQVWPLTMRSVERLSELPQTLVHSDVHLGNWYVRQPETMGLCDFQNVTRGHWSRDLAYMMVTSLTVDDRRAWERDLIRLYLELLPAHGGGVETFAATWENYRQQMLSVLAYWTVTLTPAPTMAADMQSRETALCFLERIGRAMQDLETLDSLPG